MPLIIINDFKDILLCKKLTKVIAKMYIYYDKSITNHILSRYTPCCLNHLLSHTEDGCLKDFYKNDTSSIK